MHKPTAALLTHDTACNCTINKLSWCAQSTQVQARDGTLHYTGAIENSANSAGLFTILILKRRLYLHHWQGMMLITVGAFIVGLSSLVSSSGCPDRHRLPPYTPPFRPPYNAPSATPPPYSAPCFGDVDCDPQWLHEADMGSASEAGSIAGHLMAQLYATLSSAWNALAVYTHGDEHAERCSIGHEPLLGNACVMAAQVRPANPTATPVATCNCNLLVPVPAAAVPQSALTCQARISGARSSEVHL